MPTTINPSDQTITQYNIQTGGANNLLNNVAPSSTSGVPVISQGASSQPTFGTAVVAGGGTGQVTLTNHGVLVGAGTSAITQLAAGSSGQVLQSGGGSADPAYSTATYPATATSTGTILRADGTNWSATTATYPNTTTANQLLYSSAANTIGGLSTAANSTLVTDGSSVPSLSQTLPSAVQGNITSVGTISSGTWAGTTIAVNHGGTGQTTLTNHGVLVGAGTTAITQLAAGSSGQVLQSGGASADPAYSTATYPATATSTGTILRADGTNWSATTATYPNTAGTSGNVLTSDGTNWSSSAAPGAGLLVASGQLTNSQIKNLHGTPVQIIAAPGSGKVIEIMYSMGTLNYGGSNAFVAAALSISIAYGTAVLCGTLLSNAALIATSSQAIVNANSSAAAAYTSYANTAINLYNASVTEISGNAANDNTVSYNITYRIVTIP